MAAILDQAWLQGKVEKSGAGFGSADYTRRPPREDPMHEKTPWARVVLIKPDLRFNSVPRLDKHSQIEN